VVGDGDTFSIYDKSDNDDKKEKNFEKKILNIGRGAR
jgi:hypothetical protein